MCNLKYLVVLSITSMLTTGSAFAQNQQQTNPTNPNVATAPNAAQPEDLNKLIAQQPATNNSSINSTLNTPRNGKPLNTPAATGGADYDSQIVTGLDDYRNRKKMIAERVAELQRIREEEFRRQAYEQALKAAQAREKSRMASAGKKMTNQEYFDKQTKAMQGQN